jgi:membrane protease subunit HflC
MQAYEAGLRASDTRLVLRPDSDFFKYFGNPMGKGTERAAEKPVEKAVEKAAENAAEK